MKNATTILLLTLLLFTAGCTQKQANTQDTTPTTQASVESTSSTVQTTQPVITTQMVTTTKLVTTTNSATTTTLAATTNNTTGNDSSLDVPDDLVGDNPDNGQVQTAGTDTSDLSS